MGVLAALVQALVPAQSTTHPVLRFPPRLGSARIGFAAFILQMSLLVALPMQLVPAVLCALPLHPMPVPAPVPAAPWSLLSMGKRGCPASQELSVPCEVPSRCEPHCGAAGGSWEDAEPRCAAPSQMCSLGSFPALKTPTELLPPGHRAPRQRQQCGNIDLT